jgi:hypothetical protein
VDALVVVQLRMTSYSLRRHVQVRGERGYSAWKSPQSSEAVLTDGDGTAIDVLFGLSSPFVGVRVIAIHPTTLT